MAYIPPECLWHQYGANVLGIGQAVSNTSDCTRGPHSKNDSLTVAQPGYVTGKGILVPHQSFQPHPHTWLTIIVSTSFTNTMCKHAMWSTLLKS